MRAAKLVALLACLGGFVSAPATAGPTKIVILPVVVHSAAPDGSYVSRGISDMLAARLEQIGGISVLRPEDASAASQTDDALRTARQAGGDYVLFGSFTQFGDGASLDMQCIPVGGGSDPARSIFIQSGSMGEIIPKLDDLADKVARYLKGESPTEKVAAPAAAKANGAALEDLQRRLEALEQAVFTPVVGATDAEKAAGTDLAEGAPES